VAGRPATRHTITSRARLEQVLVQVRPEEFALVDKELPPLRRAAAAVEADLGTIH